MTLQESGLTVPSRSLDVWRRLYARYSLEPWPASISPDVLKTIVPVTQADELLRAQRVTQDTSDISAGGGVYTAALTAAAGQLIRLLYCWVEATTASSRVQLSVGGSQYDITLASTAGHGPLSLLGLQLNAQGDGIGRTTTGNAGDSSRSMNVFYTLEDLF